MPKNLNPARTSSDEDFSAKPQRQSRLAWLVWQRTTKLVSYIALPVAGIFAGALVAAAEQRRPVITEQPPLEPVAPARLDCCADLECTLLEACATRQPGGLSRQARLDATSSRATRELRTTLARTPIGTEQERKPSGEAPVGDWYAWLYDHPKVTHIVVGQVVGEFGFIQEYGNFPVTECTMRVETVIKGPPSHTLSYMVNGAKTNGFSARVSHAPTCTEGDVVLVFVGDEEGVRFAVGDHTTNVVLNAADESEAFWASLVRAFVVDLDRGAP